MSASRKLERLSGDLPASREISAFYFYKRLVPIPTGIEDPRFYNHHSVMNKIGTMSLNDLPFLFRCFTINPSQIALCANRVAVI